jgi:hypothetical protein
VIPSKPGSKPEATADNIAVTQAIKSSYPTIKLEAYSSEED